MWVTVWACLEASFQFEYYGRLCRIRIHLKEDTKFNMWPVQLYFFFYIHGSAHRNAILIRSNKTQKIAGVYLLQNHSTCFGCPSHPSSGVHKTVTAASGIGHTIRATTFLQCGHLVTLEEGCCSDTMTCTRGCSYSLMYS